MEVVSEMYYLIISLLLSHIICYQQFLRFFCAVKQYSLYNAV